ncbi:MAG: transcription antitermination protein NusB [Candidatus Sericytochromatia bacterium]|nr:transcription antitermination protein NusB [Candidatus Sericytochromatia bacterium]
MNARHVARELALLSLHQLWNADPGVALESLVEQSVRFMMSECQDTLRKAAEAFNQGQDLLIESSLRDDVTAASDLLSEAFALGERALTMVDQSMDWPLMLTLTHHEDVRKYTLHLMQLVRAHHKTIDALLDQEMVGWTVDRLHSLDRDVLRLSMAELMFDGSVPIEVGLDEAVEIAKRFGSAESGGFVNGVLKKLLPEIQRARREVAGEGAAPTHDAGRMKDTVQFRGTTTPGEK